jgi:hypothetical protein
LSALDSIVDDINRIIDNRGVATAVVVGAITGVLGGSAGPSTAS